jgi:hypothetical protein
LDGEEQSVATSEEKRQALQARIRDSHPAVYLTLVSIIVALALEDLLSIVRQRGNGSVPGSASWLFALQAFGAFSAALSTWVGYCHVLITARWVLGIWDAISVMGLLAVLYLINSGVGSSQSVWFSGAALFSFAGGGVLYVNIRRASVDTELTSVLLPAPYRTWTVLWPLLLGSFGILCAVLSWMGALGIYTTTVLTGILGLLFVAWSAFFVWVWRRSIGL